MIKRCLGTFVVTTTLILALAPTPATCSDVASPVPADFQALVDKDAKFVFFIKDTAELIIDLKQMNIAPPDQKTTLQEALPLHFTSTKPIQADQFFMGWSQEDPALFEMPLMHFATRIPTDQVGKLKPKTGYEIEYQGDIAIFSSKPNQSWTSPNATGNPIFGVLPDMAIGGGMDGKGLGTRIASLSGLATGMAAGALPGAAGEGLRKAASGAKKYSDPIVYKAIQGVMKDAVKKAAELAKPLAGAKFLTMGMDTADGSITFNAYIHLLKPMQRTESFDQHLIDELPPGLPIYMALSTSAAQWMTGIEFDIIEGFLLTKAEQVPKFNEMKKQFNTAGNLIRGGLTMGMGINGGYQWSNVEVSDAAAFMSANQAIMTQLGTLGIGINTKQVGTNSWRMDVDGKKIAGLIGGSPEAQTEIEDQYGGSFGVTGVASGNVVMGKQFPFDRPTFPDTKRDDPLPAMLNQSASGQLICAMTADLASLMYMEMQKSMKRDKRTRGTVDAKAFAAAAPSELIALRIALTSPDPSRLVLSVHVPAQKAQAYHRQLEKIAYPAGAKGQKKTSTTPGPLANPGTN
ncbi:MAG: hypothetical protein CBC35_03265 [Planctomycetes bacterium TMED75]|nr:hypothetical protein [Planctomycetaceae bacterium]OUU94919.1 MAG: hypothetical protein CBC35_03265 [Planctomycetes bacterium TMED75]